MKSDFSTRAIIHPLEPRLLLAAALTPIGAQPTGALTGKIIFTSGGHGFTADNTGAGGWSTQRGINNGMVEDFGNQEQMTAYVNYLFNAGATIVPMRPVGYQPNEVVLDNDSPGVTFTGTWSNSTGTIFYGSAGDVPYRFASTSATESAVAKYTPNIPAAGFYPVYAWAADGANRAADQLYRITHSGGAMEVRVNHQRVGKGWVYLGTYYFDAGTSGYVEVSNKSTSSGSVVIADAIRFGNGMGSINRGGGVSGHTREDEASLYWIMASAGVGTAASVYAPNGEDNTDNVGAPPRWAAYMNNQAIGAATDRLFLSFHSNAGGGRGTVGLYNSPAAATAHQEAWAELVGREINDDMVALSPLLEVAWFNRSVVTYDDSMIDYGEIRSSSINSEMDATIAEVAFHDSVPDAQLLRDPKARNWVGRAAYQASVKYFNAFDGGVTPVNLLPEAPTNVRTSVDAGGNVTVSWNTPTADGIGGQAATGYRLYASKNGYAFDGGIAISGGGTTSYTIPAGQLDNGVYYFRVAATNAGGESLPSEVAAARKPSAARPQVLIVNGFDRLDRTQDVRQNTALSPGGAVVSVDRVRPRFSNSFDYVVQVASAIIGAGADVEINSAANEAVITGQVNLSNYSAVFWISGEESTDNDSFNATEQALVSNYLNAGGKFFVSGSEIAWDLDAQNNGRNFYNQALKADYVADDANTYSATGATNSIFAGISLSFDNGSQFYDVDFPDVINPLGGAVVAMNYATGGGAALQYASGGQRLVVLGFPFEAITNSVVRTSVMSAVVSYFGLKPANSSFQGTGSNDTYTVSFNPSNNTVQVLEQLAGATPQVSIFSRPSLSFLQFNTLDGNDQFSFNLTSTNLRVLIDGGPGSDNLTLTGGTLNLEPITPGPITLEGLSVDPSAVLNLASQTLVLVVPAPQRNSLLTSLNSLLRSGRNGGAWNGPGINSSTAAADLQRIHGLALTTTPGGEIKISYNIIGDLDLDGDIDSDDYARIDTALATAASGYQNGDLNYTGGPPNADDFFLIDRVFSAQTAPQAPASVRTLTASKLRRKHPHHLRHKPRCTLFRWCRF